MKKHYAPVSQANWCNMTFTASNLFPSHSCFGWPKSSPHCDSNPGPHHERQMTYQLSYPSHILCILTVQESWQKVVLCFQIDNNLRMYCKDEQYISKNVYCHAYLVMRLLACVHDYEIIVMITWLWDYWHAYLFVRYSITLHKFTSNRIDYVLRSLMHSLKGSMKWHFPYPLLYFIYMYINLWYVFIITNSISTSNRDLIQPCIWLGVI